MSISYTTSSVRAMESECGIHRVKILADSLIKRTYSGKSIECGTFKFGGFQWTILYKLLQYSYRGSDAYVSLYLKLLSKTPQDLKVYLRFSLVDQSGMVSSTDSTSRRCSYSRKGELSGFDYFFSRTAIDKLIYVKDDSFTFECELRIIKLVVEDAANKYSISVPPLELQQHLDHLLQSRECSDVSFKVKDETFLAHRTISAARSSVFRAELFGSMRESKADCIEIEDMESDVFRAMLRFIYTDMLFPTDAPGTNEGENEDIISWLSI